MTAGILSSLLYNWKGQIDHNHDQQKATRYQTGIDRAALLKNELQPFAIKDLKEIGEQQVAFLNDLDQYDLDPRMPLSARFEYVCGCRTNDNEYVVFAYIWFDSLQDAKNYVTKHGMRILGGW